MVADTKISVVFFGTPEFAIPSYLTLKKHLLFDVTSVVSQTGKPKGRGGNIKDPAIVSLARERQQNNIFQPQSIAKINSHNNILTPAENADPDQVKLCTFLNANIPDFGIVIAYGKIIPDSLLNFPKYGILNIHPSTLPRWRGAAPLQHTIFAGDNTTEVCIMRLVKELDAGPVFQRSEPIDIQMDDLGSLHDKTAEIGAKLLPEVMLNIIQKRIPPIEQKTDGITYASKWTKEDCRIRWNDPIEKTFNRIRACSPKPGAYSLYQEKIVKIFSKKFLNKFEHEQQNPGSLILISDSQLGIRGPNLAAIEISDLQFEGKNKITVKDFLNSHDHRERLRSGESIFFSS